MIMCTCKCLHTKSCTKCTCVDDRITPMFRECKLWPDTVQWCWQFMFLLGAWLLACVTDFVFK